MLNFRHRFVMAEADDSSASQVVVRAGNSMATRATRSGNEPAIGSRTIQSRR